ncbi:MAG: M28 family peptidase, partial [Anaerolineaceae bacterium]|nr:M28 family peptidase [Anaerolineaceae bacterium]
VKQIAAPEMVLGVVNLDMFGYDTDNDRCFELHVGQLPQSNRIGQCFIDSYGAYNLGLQKYDYLTDNAVRASDHASFWDANIGAIEVVEDVFAQNQPGGCPASDASPNYHTPQDTVDKLNPESGIALVRAALATISALAGPLE